MSKSIKEWDPPFISSHKPDLKCPSCGEQAVEVREREFYRDGDCTEAYCSECHANLEVQTSVEITFSEPEVAFE